MSTHAVACFFEVAVHCQNRLIDGLFLDNGKRKSGGLVVLVVALVERWTRDRKVACSTHGRGAIKSTRSTQPSIPPG